MLTSIEIETLTLIKSVCKKLIERAIAKVYVDLMKVDEVEEFSLKKHVLDITYVGNDQVLVRYRYRNGD